MPAALVVAVRVAGCGGSSTARRLLRQLVGSTAPRARPAVRPLRRRSTGCRARRPPFCAAVDESGDALFWDGSNWSTPAAASPDGTLNSVSCTSSTFCVAPEQSGGRHLRRADVVGAGGRRPGSDRTDGRGVRGLVRVPDLLRLGQHGRRWPACSTAPRGAMTPWSTTARPPSRSRTSRAPRPPFCVVVSATGNIATFDGHDLVPPAVAGAVAAPLGVVPDADLLHGGGPDRPRPDLRRLVLDGDAPDAGGRRPDLLGVVPDGVALSSVARSDGVGGHLAVGLWTGTDAGPGRRDPGRRPTSAAPSTTFCALVDSAGSAAVYRG